MHKDIVKENLEGKGGGGRNFGSRVGVLSDFGLWGGQPCHSRPELAKNTKKLPRDVTYMLDT